MKIILEKFEYYTILLAAISIIIFVFSTVILRYVFNIVMSWPDELSRYFQIYIVWMGASAAFSQNKILKIDFLHLFFKKKQKVEFLSEFITLIGSIILLFSVYKFARNSYEIMETSMILGIPIWLIGLAMGLSLIFLIIKLCLSMIGQFTQKQQ